MHGLFSVFVAIASILAIATSLAILFQKRLLETVFVASGLIILVLFLFGLLNFRGDLLVGYWLIIVLSIIAAVFSIRTIYKKRETLKELALWQGLVIVGIFSFASLYINYNRLFISWDEFSHWGIVVKHMYSLNALGSIAGSKLLFPDYFPGISLFEYFFTRANTSFIEYPVYMASNFLFFSMVFMFMKKINLKTALITLTFLTIPLIIGASASLAFYSNILVDVLIGCLFGFSVAVYFYNKYSEDNSFTVLLITVSLAVLVVSKDIGIMLAVFALGIFAIDSLLYRRREVMEYLSAKNKRINARRLALLLLPSVIAAISWLVYKIHLKIAGVAPSWKSADIGGLLGGHLKVYQTQTIDSFWYKFFTTPFTPLPTSLFGSMVVLLIILYLWSVFIKNRTIARRLLLSGSLLFAGLFVYAAAILTLYVLIFSEYEATKLASWERYMATYLTAFAIFVLSAFLYDTRILQSFYKKHKDILLVTFLFLAMAVGFMAARATREGQVLSSVAHARKEVAAIRTTRQQYEEAQDWKQCLNSPDDKLNIIATNTKGNERNILKYTLYPAMAQSYYRFDFSEGEKPYYSGDIWTMILTPQDWGKYIAQNYTLVYIYKYDEPFKASYGSYFDNLKDDQLYRVVKTNNKTELKSVNSNSCTVTKQ